MSFSAYRVMAVLVVGQTWSDFHVAPIVTIILNLEVLLNRIV